MAIAPVVTTRGCDIPVRNANGEPMIRFAVKGLLLLFPFGSLLALAVHRVRLRSALVAERRRIAHDLHDELAQETRYVAHVTRRLARESRAPELGAVARAAENADHAARFAVRDLVVPPDGDIEGTLERAVGDLGDRTGAQVHVSVADNTPRALPRHYRRPVLQIAREATLNALHHGGAQRVHVRLGHRGGWLLRVTDDGTGFDAETTSRHGFGLVTMRERAGALGGTMQVTSRPGDGARVDVSLP